MLRQKRLYALFAMVLVLWALSFTAYGQPVPDLSQKGSIKITMHYGDKAVSGGSMTLYRAGAVRERDGNYDFVPTEDFADCGVSLTDIQSAGLAKELTDYAVKERLQGKTQDIDGEGVVIFTELEPGLYLLVQNRAASGYRKASPFLVSVPMLEEENYIFQIILTIRMILMTRTNQQSRILRSQTFQSQNRGRGMNRI